LTTQSQTPLHLAVSLYNAETGAPLSVAGSPFLELGTLASEW